MAEVINKEIAKELMKLEGEARGVTLRADGEYVLKEKGEEGLKKLEEEMANLGFPLNYRDIKSTSFYPLGWRAVSLAAIKKVFSLKDEDFFGLGVFEAKFSLIVRTFMKYFFSIDLMIEKAPIMWKKYYTTGDMEIVEYEKEKKRGVLRINNFRLHGLQCRTLEGFIASVIGMIVNSRVSCKETKCVFLGDEHHEFSIQW